MSVATPGHETNHEFSIELNARIAFKDHWEEFQYRWSQLPPLVRAGFAARLIEICDNGRNTCTKQAAVYRAGGLERRATVNEAFARADLAVAKFFAELCKEADDEAAAKGIDADIKPEPKSAYYGVAIEHPPKRKRKKKK